MLSKAKLKEAVKKQDFETARQLIPTVKQFKKMARNKSFHRLIAPTIKLLFSDKNYYKNRFSINTMTQMSMFTHDVMKDFKYLKEDEREIVQEALMRPLLDDEAMFLYAINHYFEFNYFQVTYAKYKQELANMVIRYPDLFWRIIQSFEHLQLFCQEHADYARQAIIFVLCNPEKMKSILINAAIETAFAGYCLVYSLTDFKICKEVVTTIIDSAKAHTYLFFKPAERRDSKPAEPREYIERSPSVS